MERFNVGCATVCVKGEKQKDIKTATLRFLKKIEKAKKSKEEKRNEQIERND